MAVRAVAGRIFINQINQPAAIPPVAFQDLNDTAQFSYSFWFKMTEPINYDPIFQYTGRDGSGIMHGHQLLPNNPVNQFFVRFNAPGGINQSTGFAGDVVEDRWTVVCVSIDQRHFRLYIGYEADTPDPDTPVQLISIGDEHIDGNLNIPFFFLHLAPSHNTAMCNIKYWNAALTFNEFQAQVNNWGPSGTPAPMWCSTFRTPGDISNIANPRTSPDWNNERGYSQQLQDQPFTHTLEISLPDPAYMAKHTACPTWIYPLVGKDFPEFVDVNPITTPAVATTYKATEFWQMEDRGSIPLLLTSFTAVEYYAYPFHEGVGAFQSSSWPLLIDNNGTELVTDFIPEHRFEQDTGITDIATLTPLNMYQWKFGGQFTYQPPAGVGTATAKLGYAHLLVTYVGFPTGNSNISNSILTGLFALNRGGKSSDRYNQGVEVKIPNPTIRTAYIGE